jgi:hypothetical protein
MKIPFLGGAYEGRSPNVAPQTCINWYYESGKDGECLVGTPGSSLFVDLGSGAVRGGIEYNNRAYFVMGDTLYEVNSAGTATSRGTLTTSSGRVSMAHNGVRTGANQQIFIADGTQRYIYDNTTSTLTGYTDYAATTVAFIDGYFLFTIANSDRFYITNLYDGVTVTGTDFFTFEGGPDIALSVVADQREVFGFGEKTLEVWYNSGDTDNTFQRFQGGFKQMGCAARFSPQRLDNGIAWLTQNERGNAMVAILGEGYSPQIISTPEVNYQLSTYTTISDAFAYVYQNEGHEFYVLTFPTEEVTWVYDASTREWHQRAHTINGIFPHRERYNCHVFAFNKHLMGDFNNGKIYELDSDLGTIDSTRIPRERTSDDITDEEKRVRISAFQLDMEEGTGDPNDSTDTSIWLSYSKDGGHTFSNEIERSIGDAGEYRKRVIWRRLGWGRHWIFRVRTWSPNAVIIKGAYARTYGERWL